jgi:hypothetical protein
MKKTYSEKLRDPRWQKMRLQIMERDGFACQFCRSTEKTLNIHHKIYDKKREPWEYDGSALVTCCEACHTELEVAKWNAGLIIGDNDGLRAFQMFNRATDDCKVSTAFVLGMLVDHPDETVAILSAFKSAACKHK